MAVSDSLDTNLMLRLIMNDVPGQREKVLELLYTPRTVHYLEDLVIAEILYALENFYLLERADAVERLAMFLVRFDGCISYNNTLTSLAFPLYLEHPKLSFYDCCLACYAEIKHHEPLFTFDKKLAKQLPQAKVLA